MLNIGADAYIRKPFDPRILILRGITMKQLSLILLILIGCIGLTGCEPKEQKIDTAAGNIEKQDQGIYILYKDGSSNVQYLTNDLEKVTDFEVAGGWDLCSTGNGKVYVSIPGDAHFNGDCLKVLENGEIVKTIELTYDLPMDIRFNKFDKRAYVSHKYKVTFANENCISIIDTEADEEVDSFIYDELVLDITFSSDDKMYISSQNIKTKKAQIDVVNLKSYEIENHMFVDEPLTSIEYCESTQLLYGVSNRKESPVLYSVNCEEGLVSFLDISTKYPSKLILDTSGDKPLFYISNVDVDNSDAGHIITIYDPIEQREIKKLENIDGIYDFVVRENAYAVARYKNRAYKVDVLSNEIITVEIPFPISVEKSVNE